MKTSRNKAPDPAEFLPMSDLSFQVLLALGDGPAHGYAIGKKLEERTSGRLKPTTGGLYGVLRRHVEDGLVREASAPKGADRRRHYFRLTELGRQVAAREAERLHELVLEARAKNLFPARR